MDTKISAQEHAAAFTGKQRTIAVLVVAIAFLMDLLDTTIVNIAIPSIQRGLGASYTAIQWIVAGYALTFAVLLITSGRMGDVFGYKKLFMLGVAGFTVASLVSGVSTGPTMLILARLLQGVTAALMVPQVMALVQVMYKPEDRLAVNGMFGAMTGISAALGPVLGGLLLKANFFHWDWRLLFLINVPIGLLGLAAGAKFLPNGKSPHPLKLDIVGTFFVMVAMLLLVFPLIQGRELGWPLWTYLMIATSIPAFAGFAWWQKKLGARGGSPLVLPQLFKYRSFNVGLLLCAVLYMALIGFSLISTLMLQVGLGFSPLHAALTIIPLSLSIAAVVGAFTKVLPKLGRRAFILGPIIMAMGLLYLAWIPYRYGIHTSSWDILPGLVLDGVGMGFVFGSLNAVVLNDVDPRDAGSAAGVLEAVQQVGGSIGVALVGVIFFWQINHAAMRSFAVTEPVLQNDLSAQHISISEQAALTAKISHCFVNASAAKDSSVIPASCKQPAKTPPRLIKAVTESTRQATFVNIRNAFRWGMLLSVLILVTAPILALFLPRRFRPEAYQQM